MSRIGKKPVTVPAGVKVELRGQELSVQGPKGKVSLSVHPEIGVSYDQAHARLVLTRPSESTRHRTLHGTMRSLVNNMVCGAAQGFARRLEVHGVGYSAKLAGRQLQLLVGFSQPVLLAIPEGVTVELTNPTLMVISGADKDQVGQFAAQIYRVRPPEPYKGKGIRREGQVVRRKVGKAVVGHEL